MGNGKSSSRYTRLPSSSVSDNQKPLLDMDNNKICSIPFGEQLMKVENDGANNRNKGAAGQEKKMNIADLEGEIRKLRSAMSKLESRLPPIVEMNTEIRELRSVVSRVESRLSLTTPATNGSESNWAPKNEVDKLANRVIQLELDSLVHVKKHDIIDMKKLVEKNAELENKVTELGTTIHQLSDLLQKQKKSLSAPSSDLMAMDSTNSVISESQSTEGPAMDIVGCLVVLIFLTAILIGINLRSR